MVATKVTNMLIVTPCMMHIQCLMVFKFHIVLDAPKDSLFIFQWLRFLEDVIEDTIEYLVDHLTLLSRHDSYVQSLHLSNYRDFHICLI